VLPCQILILYALTAQTRIPSGKSLVARLVTFESKKRNLRVISVTGSESSSNTDYWLLSNIIDQVMTMHERSKRKISEVEKPIFKKKMSNFSMMSLPATDIGSSPTSSVSSPSSKYTFSPDFGRNSMRRDTLSCTSPDDLQRSTGSKTSRFRDFVSDLLLKQNDEVVEADNTTNSMSVIHGFPVMDLLYLIGDVFREGIESSSPSVTPRMHQLLLKALITRCLQIAFQDDLTVLVADNMQWCDIPSAAALVDLIGCVDSGFGVLCYRSTLISRESEKKVFSTLRGMCYSVPLPPLKSPDVAELVRHIVGSEHQSAVTKEMITRILARTQGNPGLIEVLVTAFRGEADKGLNPNIEDIRTPVSELHIVTAFNLTDRLQFDKSFT
jgi:predicted ATPase